MPTHLVKFPIYCTLQLTVISSMSCTIVSGESTETGEIAEPTETGELLGRELFIYFYMPIAR